MGRRKDDLTRLTISQIESLTGASYRTVKDRLKDLQPVNIDGTAYYYDSKQALALIYTPKKNFRDGSDNDDEPENDVMVLNRERALLARSQREKFELQNAERRGQLIPVELIEQSWTDMVVAFRSRVLGIPTRASLQVTGLKETTEVEALLKQMCNEALDELAGFNLSRAGQGERGQADDESSEQIETSPQSQDE